jgi:hypothetical protein
LKQEIVTEKDKEYHADAEKQLKACGSSWW